MRFAITAIILFLGVPAFSQPADTGIVLNIDIGYNTAYRNATWVPVDVLIENNQRDFDGWAEVRVFNTGDTLQSPTYRVPADCPQNSKKRFRLYVWIDNAVRVEAVLYENNRLAVDAPAYVEPQPIAADDFLAIILDEDAVNYQFLYEPLRAFKGTRRLSRKDITSSTLGLLPDHLAAYQALDFIIVGDIDLSRTPPAQRRLMLEYVELGGTLVVFTGVQAQRVRDSWLAPHLGVEIESPATRPEALYRAAVFGDSAPVQYDEARIVTAATLAKNDAGVSMFGRDALLAARRQYGNGQIITFAIDAASHALQDDPRYADLWHTILRSVQGNTETLDTEAMGVTFVNNLPQVSGVSIRPVSDVLIYLGLYIGVGIVLNWVFWSRMGRREYAWLTLLLVSFSFTAYAIVSGTSGIEGRRTVHNFTLMHLGQESYLAWEHTLTGILSARVTEVNQPLEKADVLVREAGVATSAGRWGMPQSSLQRPFQFIEQPEPAIQDLRIGANEVRGYSTTRFTRLQGTLEGVLEDTGGVRRVSVTNRTGLDIEFAMLFTHGQFHPLEPADSEDTYTLAENPVMHSGEMKAFSDATSGGYWPAGFYSTDWDSLVSYLTLSPLIDPVTSVPNPSLGPYIIARMRAPEGPVQENQRSRHTTVVFADIDYRTDRSERFPLPQRFGDYSRYTIPLDASSNSWQVTLTATPVDFYVRAPEHLRDSPHSHVEIVLAASGADSPDVMLTEPGDANARRELQGLIDERTDGSQFIRHYRIDHWSRLVDTVTGDIHLRVSYVPRNAADHLNVRATAEIVVEPSQISDEEWPGWQ